ncbi:histone-lysine N-methyltransferase 2B isoform X5 [Patagioenas fasciata]|uniref:histone-lysine N-methyltransferase 2B isoform X5 n=1 Tax=Patagioenas fasciata TaxID=372321 RepID=UPI003A9997EA
MGATSRGTLLGLGDIRAIGDTHREAIGDIGDTHRDIGDTIGDIGDTPRDISDTPRDIGDTLGDTRGDTSATPMGIGDNGGDIGATPGATFMVPSDTLGPKSATLGVTGATFRGSFRPLGVPNVPTGGDVPSPPSPPPSPGGSPLSPMSPMSPPPHRVVLREATFRWVTPRPPGDVIGDVIGDPPGTFGDIGVTSGDPTMTPGDLRVTPGGLTMTPGDPMVTLGDPKMTLSDPTMTSGDPRVTLSDPTVTSGDPRVTLSDPTMTSGDPKMTLSDPTMTPSDPMVTLGDPTVTSGDPTMTPSNPRLTLADPTVTPGRPSPLGPAHPPAHQSVCTTRHDVTNNVINDVTNDITAGPPPEPLPPLPLPRFPRPGAGDDVTEGADDVTECADDVTKATDDVTKAAGDDFGDIGRVFDLLSRARVQLQSIDRRRPSPTKEEPEEPEGEPGDLQGPRIKHVCRHAAVALGQARATVPESVPRLSALPRHGAPPDHETSSDSDAAPSPKRLRVGAEHGGGRGQDDPPTPPPTPPPPPPPPPPHPLQGGGGGGGGGGPSRPPRKNREVRCGRCRGCRRPQDCAACPNCRDKPKFGGPNTKKQCCVYRRCDKIEARKLERLAQRGRCPPRVTPWDSEDSGDSGDMGGDTGGDPGGAEPPRRSGRRLLRPRPRAPPTAPPTATPTEPDSAGTATDERPLEDPEEPPRPRRPLQPLLQLRARRRMGDWAPPGSPQSGWGGRGRPGDGHTRLRVDFKEDPALDNVWLMGGLSVVGSVPPSGPVLCLLCASRGQHQLVLCQVCCQPFHRFCLGPEAPAPGQTRWSCRRCRSCHGCGRRGRGGKRLLECSRCRRCFHPGCLGPGAPPQHSPSPTQWLCWGCWRCRGCGATPVGDTEAPWDPRGGLCPPCTHTRRCCPECSRGGPEEGEEPGEGEGQDEPPLPRCPRCQRCLRPQEEPPGELQGALRGVLGALLGSAHGHALRRCHQCPPGGVKLHPGPCDLGAVGALLENGHYGSLQSFTADVLGVLLRGKGGGGDGAEETFRQLMGGAFPGFDIRDALSCSGGGAGGRLPQVVPPPSPDHNYAMGTPPDPPTSPGPEGAEPAVPKAAGGGGADERLCALCLTTGDQPAQDAGRLLYMGQDEWAHVNCALWSAEVQEDGDGALRNVHAAVARGRQMRCEHCGRPGATVGCCLATCVSNFHFMCARRRRAAFQADKRVFCRRHRRLLDGTALVPEGGFSVLRRVFVDFGGLTLKRKFLGGLEPDSVHMSIGSIRIDTLGALTELSESGGRLFPVGFQCWRLYWSTRDARRRCWYRCRILETPPGGPGDPHPPTPPEENRTIAHGASSPGSPPTPPEGPRGPPSPRPRGPPGFSPNRRPGSSSRPLPSPGSAPALSRHILTAGDPEFPPLPRRARHPVSPPAVTRRCPQPPPAPPGGDSSDGDNDDDGDNDNDVTRRYSRFPRTVVTPRGPLCPLPPSHIQQLDGAGDAGDKGQRGGQGTTGGSHLPSDILEFVLRNSVGDNGDNEDDGDNRGDAYPVWDVTRGGGANGDVTRGGGGPGDVTRGGGTYGEATNGDVTRGGGTYGRGGPGDVTHGDVTYGRGGPGDVTHGSVTYGRGGPGDVTHGSVTYGRGGPGDVTHGDATHGDVTNGRGGPGDVTHGHGGPGDVTHGDVTYGDVTYGRGGPGDVTHGHGGPGDVTHGSVTYGRGGPGDVTYGRGGLENVTHGHGGPGDVTYGRGGPGDVTHGSVTYGRGGLENVTHGHGGPGDVTYGRGGPGDVTHGSVTYGRGGHGDVTHGDVTNGRGGPGDVTYGDATHGDVTNGRGGPGDVTHGNVPYGDATHGDVTNGRGGPGSVTHGSVTHGRVLDGLGGPGDVTRGRGTHGDVTNGDVTRGDVTHGRGGLGSVTYGDITPGSVTNGHGGPGSVTYGGATNGHAVPRDDVTVPRDDVTGSQWGTPWGHKRPGDALGTGTKRPRLGDTNGDTSETSDTNGDTRSPSAVTAEPPWECAGGSSEDEAPPPAGPSPPRPQLCFEISNEDGLSVTAPSIEGAWRAVTEKVQEARANARLRHLSFAGLSGSRWLGVQHEAVVFLVEQLPGAGLCPRYQFRYHPRRDPPHPTPRNPSGCARAELYVRKCTFDMFSFLASQHRALPQGAPRDEEDDDTQLKPPRRAASLELPLAMRFRHLKRSHRESVGVYRSAIHGRGLFCKRNIEAGEMVIEYSGIVVRSVLTDKREKFYDSKGIGCYMFRIDDAEVVDATMHGSAARFINHSCEPNCYSRVIQVEGHKHIVIFALRRILRGEELTYDYKFPIEEPAAKLPCNCGAKRCRRFLN